MKQKLIIITGSPCVGKTTVADLLFQSYENSAAMLVNAPAIGCTSRFIPAIMSFAQTANPHRKSFKK